MKTNEKDTKRGVVPPLRFPEFSDAGNWVYLEGNKVFEQISNKNIVLIYPYLQFRKNTVQFLAI